MVPKVTIVFPCYFNHIFVEDNKFKGFVFMISISIFTAGRFLSRLAFHGNNHKSVRKGSISFVMQSENHRVARFIGSFPTELLKRSSFARI